MKLSIFNINSQKTLKRISNNDWILTLRFISDDPDWIRTRLLDKGYSCEIKEYGIGKLSLSLKEKCEYSGVFWDPEYDSFEWRSHTFWPKDLRDSTYIY